MSQGLSPNRHGMGLWLAHQPFNNKENDMKRKIMETMLMRFVRYVIDWRKTRSLIRELNMLSDRTLKDIGISRGEINYLVYTLEQEEQKGTKDEMNRGQHHG